MLFPELETIAVIVTLVGGATATYGFLYGFVPTTQESIRDAMIEGHYNICINDATSTYHPHDPDFEYTVTYYTAWNESPYIYKFFLDGDHVKKETIKPFDEFRTVSYENGKWGYQ